MGRATGRQMRLWLLVIGVITRQNATLRWCLSGFESCQGFVVGACVLTEKGGRQPRTGLEGSWADGRVTR